MGIFSDILFGAQSTYSQDKRSLSRDQIRVLVSRVKIQTLSGEEESLIEETIDAARENGRISLYTIDELLRSLVSRKKISINDKKGVLKQFEQYFEKQ